jgi:lambda repressor-like predicted transcriptional regulator
VNGPYRRFPLRPLLAAAGAETVTELARRTGVHRDVLYRYGTQGVPEPRTDRLACAVGLNPVEVWPDWTDAA